jgi:Protein tyrosine and serine/threonine kinase
MYSLNVVLRDLKPDNVGFNRQGVTKICDFGFAREIHTIHPQEIAGSLRYMAPEAARYGVTSCACDVYSFGVLLYEMCTLSKPFKQFNKRSEFLGKVIERGYRPSLSSIPSIGLRRLIERCWHSELSMRPSMSTVVQELKLEIMLCENRTTQSMSRCLSSSSSSSYAILRRKHLSTATMSSPCIGNIVSGKPKRCMSQLSSDVPNGKHQGTRNSTWSNMTDATAIPNTNLKPKSKAVITNSDLRLSLGLSKNPTSRKQISWGGTLLKTQSKDRIGSFLKSSSSNSTLTTVDMFKKTNNSSLTSLDSHNASLVDIPSMTDINVANNDSASELAASASATESTSSMNSFSMSRLSLGMLRKPLQRRRHGRSSLQNVNDAK